MTEPRRIYLDNAATSWPKPESVYRAVDQAMREWGAPAGRGVYREAVDVERSVAETRRRVAELIGVTDPKRIVFTANGTDSLNLALHGLLHPGDHVVTSVIEHNSVLRPLRFLEQHNGIEVSRIGCDSAGVLDPQAVQQAIRPKTRLVAIVHASNVTGAIQPIAAIGQIARERGVLFLVDAAQSLGQLPFSVDEVSADLVAAPGHKGLLGPLGTGMLYVGKGVESQLQSVRQGGTGTRSEEDSQPETLPDKYEAGNHNVPGIAGMGAGVGELLARGVNAVRTHHRNLTARLIEGLRDVQGVQLTGPANADRQVGVLSLQINGYDPQDVAAILESSYRIQIRAGFHCASQTHRGLGTDVGGGTVRISVGITTTAEDVDATVAAFAEIAASAT